MSKDNLHIDWATHNAAKYAVENWHYSGILPVGKLVKIGVWENKKFIGVVIFSWGANNNLAGAYGLKQDRACELTRIALTTHQAEVSRIVKLAFLFLKKNSPLLRLIISYADPEQGHHGGVYQAGNWIYAGHSTPNSRLLMDGKKIHLRSAYAKYGTSSPEKITQLTGQVVKYGPPEFKHVYLMPLDTEMREQIEVLSKPYPKRVKQAMTSDQLEQRQCDTDPHAPNSVIIS